MQAKKNKKAAIYFSAGIGDALLLTPLIKELKNDGYHITGIFTSKFLVHGLYECIELLDDKMIILSKPKMVWFIGRYAFTPFDISFVNFFAAGKGNLVAASQTSKKIITNKKVKFTYEIPENIHFIEPESNIHDSEQNLHLYKKAGHITEADFHLNIKKEDLSKFNLPKSYIALQAGAGNNETPFKIWDIKKWKELITLLSKEHPDKHIVLLGDDTEIEINKKLEGKNVVNLTGKTSLKELLSVIQNACCFTGGDSGLMHTAVALNKPTFTIWGASNEKLYSYNSFNPIRHQIVFNTTIKCRPCSAWINANKTRVKNPSTCPDFICLQELSSKIVYQHLQLFLSHHS